MILKINADNLFVELLLTLKSNFKSQKKKWKLFVFGVSMAACIGGTTSLLYAKFFLGRRIAHKRYKVPGRHLEHHTKDNSSKMHKNRILVKLTAILMIFGLLSEDFTNGAQIKGPVFINEPRGDLYVDVNKGGYINCIAYGDPSPEVQWYSKHMAAEKRERLIQNSDFVTVRNNGTLIFKTLKQGTMPPHGGVGQYICHASNVHGSIVSTPVTVRFISSGTQRQMYAAQVYDEYVIIGNSALLKCHMPTFYSHQLSVKAWIREDNFVIKANQTRQQMVVTNNGNLHINDVTDDMDFKLGYWCQVIDKITGQTILSETSGRLRLRGVSGHHQQVPPTIKDISQDIGVMEGEEVELACLAAGVPTPQYIWHCSSNKSDKKTCLDVGRRTVVKTKIEAPGTYTYSCVAQNKYGRDTKSTTVIVREKLQVFIQPNFQVVNSGDDAILECNVKGYPISDITWLQNGEPLTKANFISRSQIKISSFDRNNQGMYQCFAKNKWEIVQACAQIVLGDAVPTFVKTFKSRTMQPGPSISLKCIANGRPIPNIIWRFNGIVLKQNNKILIRESKEDDGTSESTLVMKNVGNIDGGEYSCEATNRIKSLMYRNSVNVYGLPFVHALPDVTVAAEQDVYLRCYVSGYPIQLIEWSRSDRYGYLPFNAKDFGNGTLYIKSVKDNRDEGEYKCTASNGRGQQSEKSMTLKILIKPTIANQISPIKTTLKTGNPFSIMCSVVEGDEPVNIRWLKNNESVKLGIGTDISTTKMYSVLQIRQVSEIHTGNYTCLAQNKVGRDTMTVELRVLVSPKWKTKPSDMISGIGQDVRFPCSAIGFPNPEIQWFKVKGKQLQRFIREGDKHGISANGSLTLRLITKADEGKYSCLVSNGISPDLVQEVSLIIGEKPSITFINETSLIKLGKSFTLHCKAGDNSSEILWYKNSKEVITNDKRTIKLSKNKKSSTLIITNSTIEDKGDYKCIVRNKYGETEEEIAVYVSADEKPKEHGELPNLEEVKTTQAEVNLSTKSPNEGSAVTEKSSAGSNTITPTKKTEKNIELNRDETRSEEKPKEKESDEALGVTSNIFSGGFKMGHALFIIPVIVIVVLLIAIIITLVIYLSTRRNNTERHNDAPRMSIDQRSNKGTIDRHSMKMYGKSFYSDADSCYRDNRYGRLERPPALPPGMPPSSNRSSAAYEIPDYYASGSKAYATLQPSLRQQTQTKSSPNHHPYLSAQSSL